MTGFVIPLAFLCVLLYTGQNFFNKLFSGSYPGPSELASPVFSTVYGAVIALVTFLLNGCRFAPSAMTILLGIINGLVVFFYNLGMIQAARRGPYTLQILIAIFGGILLPLLFSALVWGDQVTLLQLLGIAVMLISFIALNGGGLKLSGVKKGYYAWIVCLFLANGAYGCMLDAQQRLYPTQRNEMIILTFVSLAAISLLYLLLFHHSSLSAAYAMGRRSAAHASLSSVCAAFAVYLLMLLLQYVPSYVLFTVNNGGVLVLSAVLSAIVLKEKLSRIACAGILLSILSLVLLSV